MRSLSRAVLGGCGPVLALLLVSSGCGDGLSGIFGKQSVKLVGPGGGETWSLNTPCEITWTCTATAGVKIEISRDNWVTWETITDLADASP